MSKRKKRLFEDRNKERLECPRKDMARHMMEFVQSGGRQDVADEFVEASGVGRRPQGCSRTSPKRNNT